MTEDNARTLLVVHHTPSPFMQAMFEAVLAGATDPEIEGVKVVRRPALTVSPTDMLEADGYLLGTPANLGYMSGALKHAFDVCYYPCLDSTRGRPYGLYLHGNEGTEGAERAVGTITTGLGWVKTADYVVVSGKPSKSDLEACWELGATVAAQLMG
ncbi:flavodoxin family protein [Rhodococcus sp. NPDC060090]|uniref:flavodoxin family protein n=1 Tax=Rhodococcus sp. NPDC060090 TaxID=3347056 RepID=UPI003652F602